MKNIQKNYTLKAVSLYASSGIGEYFLKDIGIQVVLANELLEDRAELYRKLYPETKMITGDIADDKVFNNILDSYKEKVDLLIATPPCQGLSIAGKNRSNSQMLLDPRNQLIYHALEYIDIKMPDYVLIENVPRYLNMEIPYKNKVASIIYILKSKYNKIYEIEYDILDASDYGVPQYRRRAIIKMHKKGLKWDWPKKSKNKVTVKEAIDHLPSIESGEKTDIPFHFGRNHTQHHIEIMKHTPTDKSAHDNEVFYPKSKDGKKVKGYNTTYRRISWDRPAPTITMRNDAISSQRNVHPGYIKNDGTYSDARVLSPLELMILDSLPEKNSIPEDTSELLLRKVLGESVPPLLIKKILQGIKR